MLEFYIVNVPPRYSYKLEFTQNQELVDVVRGAVQRQVQQHLVVGGDRTLPVYFDYG